MVPEGRLEAERQSIQRRATRLLRALEEGNADLANARGYFVPGRIEVLGKHTDYAGGRSLTCATRQGFCMAVSRRESDHVALRDFGRQTGARFDLAALETAGFVDWRRYPLAVLKRLSADVGGTLCGAEFAFDSDLPSAAGASSSSALIIAVLLGLTAVNSSDGSSFSKENFAAPENLASYTAAIESGGRFGNSAGGEGVGTEGGSEDHTAILCSQSEYLGLYRYRPTVQQSSVPLPAGWVFLVAVSGVRASKASTARVAYNRVSRLAREAAAAWRAGSGRNDPHLGAAIREVGPDEVRATIARQGSNEFDTLELLERFDHFIEETEEIVPRAVAALESGEVQGFGEAARRSHMLAERKLHNQVPETTWLVRSAWRVGAPAASAFGAGFGGSVWALVREPEIPDFLGEWKSEYAARLPERAGLASFFSTDAGPPARRWFECA